MTREEEIERQGTVYSDIPANYIEWSDGYDTKDDKAFVENAFIEGAKWADKTMIDKFCKWIESTDIDMEYWNSEDGVCKELLINDIKKQWNYEAMDSTRP